MTDATPIYRLDKAGRRQALARFVDRNVTIYEDLHRDGSVIIEHAGELLAIAYPRAAISDQAILRLDRRTMDGMPVIAVGLASIAGIATASGMDRAGRIPQDSDQ